LKPKGKEKKAEADGLAHIPKKLRELISEDVNKFSKIAGLTKFKVRILYPDKDNKDNVKIDDPDRGERSIVAASTQINLPYLTVDLRIYPFLVEQWENGYFVDDDVNDIIAHEISHIATHRLYQLATASFRTEEELHNSWEELTTLLGRMLNTIDNLDKRLTNRE